MQTPSSPRRRAALSPSFALRGDRLQHGMAEPETHPSSVPVARQQSSVATAARPLGRSLGVDSHGRHRPVRRLHQSELAGFRIGGLRALGQCRVNAYDCRGFSTQVEAQAVYWPAAVGRTMSTASTGIETAGHATPYADGSRPGGGQARAARSATTWAACGPAPFLCRSLDLVHREEERIGRRAVRSVTLLRQSRSAAPHDPQAAGGERLFGCPTAGAGLDCR